MKVRDALEQSGLLQSGLRVLCALSGGGDSVCLTHALARLAPERSLQVAAAHFSHGLRPAAAEPEKALCRALCQSLSIPLYCGEGDTPVYAAAHGMGTEEAARTLRYAFLERTAEEQGYDVIAVAHQMDDNAETLLWNLIRGCGPAGLEGIPPRRGRIIRPLLQCSRREIEAYLAQYRLPYATDLTNLEGDNARAVLRRQVFPLLRQLNPAAAEHMASCAADVRRQGAALTLLAEDYAAAAEDTGAGLLLSIPALLALPRESACRALQLLQRQAGGKMLTRPQLEGIFALCQSPSPSGRLSLSGTALQRRYDRLLLTGVHPPGPPEPVTLTACGQAQFGGWRITVCPDAGEGGGFCLPEEEVFPLTVRARRTGDSISLPGGHRTVKKWMIDRKIPKDLRDTTPILCHNNKILAVADLWHSLPETEKETPRIRIICRRKRS